MMLGPNQRAYIEFKAEQEAKANQPQPRKPYVYKPISGYVYVIHCKGFPYYKIGMTKLLPEVRLTALQTAIPFELELEYAVMVEDAQDVEAILHHHNESKCVKREWFILNKEDLASIKEELLSLKLAKDSRPIRQKIWTTQRQAVIKIG